VRAVILKDEMRAARMNYKCDAYDWWVQFGGNPADLTPDERLMLEAAEADKGRILPGQVYRYTRGVFEGSMFTQRMRPGMDHICRAHGLYEDA